MLIKKEQLLSSPLISVTDIPIYWHLDLEVSQLLNQQDLYKYIKNTNTNNVLLLVINLHSYLPRARASTATTTCVGHGDVFTSPLI